MTTLMDLPVELLLLCTEHALVLTVRVAAVTYMLRIKLIYQCRGLRYICDHPLRAIDIERQLLGYFCISELVLTGNYWLFYYTDIIERLYKDCPQLKTVLVNPAFRMHVYHLYYDTPNAWMRDLLLKMKAERGFEIKARVRYIISHLRQLKLNEMPQWKLVFLPPTHTYW